MPTADLSAFVGPNDSHVHLLISIIVGKRNIYQTHTAETFPFQQTEYLKITVSQVPQQPNRYRISKLGTPNFLQMSQCPKPQSNRAEIRIPANEILKNYPNVPTSWRSPCPTNQPVFTKQQTKTNEMSRATNRYSRDNYQK